MTPDVKRAAPVGRPEAALDTATDTINTTPPETNAQGKSLAVWLFNIGARSLVETTAAFRLRPEWRSA